MPCSTRANRAALRAGGTVVWLRARPETLARRVGRTVDRPLLAGAAGGPAAALARIDDERRALYEEVATVVVDVDALTPGAVADRVIAAAEHGDDTPQSRDDAPQNSGSPHEESR